MDPKGTVDLINMVTYRNLRAPLMAGNNLGRMNLLCEVWYLKPTRIGLYVSNFVQTFIVHFDDDDNDHIHVEGVTELWPPTGLLSILQIIYAHGEPWWNDVDKEKVLIRPLELSGNRTSSHLVASRRNGRRE
jgi:hypothetical protein